MSEYGSDAAIFPQHAELLRASAILPEVAAERGYVSVDTKTRLEPARFAKSQRGTPGLLIPIYGTDGTLRLHQYRPDNPRLDPAGKPRKYETPWKQSICLDVPRRIRDQLTDPAVPLWITEGARKADAAVSAGACCIALIGVDGWMRDGHALPDWQEVALNGRVVIIVFDSDVMTKPSVAGALDRLTTYLTYRGAIVFHGLLPELDSVAKTGLDDFLAAGHTLAEIEAIAASAPDDGTPRDEAHTRTSPDDQAEDVCAPDEVCAHTPPLASAPDLLAEVIAAVERLGVTGESRIVRGTYLTVLSQVLPEPISMVAKGASAGGKSYSTKTTLRLVHPAVLYNMTAASQRALIYTTEEFTRRTIVMFEATALREVAETQNGDLTATLVRTLLSEGRIVYPVAERGPDGKIVTRVITKEGPTNLIVTTTADALHPENETRLLSLTVDESEQQTREVLRKIATRRNQLVPEEPPDLTPWHQLFHWLRNHAEHRVWIPYAAYLAETAAASVVRMRRDFGVLLGMVEVHAILHQVSRKRDEHGRIIATRADYRAARDILADAFAVSSGQTVKESVRRAVSAVADLGGQVSDVTVAQVARHLKRDRTRVTRGLKEASDLGYLTNQETKPGRAARYQIGPDPLPEDKAALPEDIPEEDPPDVGDEECGRTPAQGAHPSPQVSDGCAGVRGVRGGARDGVGDAEVSEDAQRCTICGEPLAQTLIDAGFTDHGEEASQ